MRKRVYVRRTAEEKPILAFTFKQAFDYFYSAKKGEEVRKTTLTTYDEHYRFFVRWLEHSDYEINKVDELTVVIVRDYMLYMREHHYNFKQKCVGLSIQTVNARIRFLKTWYSFLFTEELLEKNIMESIKFLKVDEKRVDLLTEDEMKRLFEAPDKKLWAQWRDFVLFHVLYDTALRISEAISLDCNDIDIVRRQIVLPPDKAKDRRYRTIPITNHTLKLLIRLMDENKDVFGNHEAVFLNWFGERLASDTFRRNLARYLKKAGINKKYSCHDFRRQSITEMLKNGASVFAVQSIAGHSQISTTRKYVFFDDKTIRHQHDLYSPLNRMAYKKRK